MTSPNSEALRQEYNKNYQRPVDTWSCHDPKEAAAIVELVHQHLSSVQTSAMAAKSMLDVGCAKGHISEAFRQAGWEAHGLDYSDVAVATATRNFPRCTFHHMDGFNPQFDIRFDLIFMRGFSGCNTLDVSFVASLCNRYMALLKPGGVFVLAYSTDFSGMHRTGDTVCWNQAQIRELTRGLSGQLLHTVFVPRRTVVSRLKVRLGRILRRRSKFYFYLLFGTRTFPQTTMVG